MKEEELVLSPKAERLYKRLVRWPSKKFAKRYARVSVRERGEHIGPKRLSAYLKSNREFIRTWWRPENHYHVKRYSLAMLKALKEPLTGSQAFRLYHQVKASTHLRSILIAEGDPYKWAGNSVETRDTHYRMYGQLVVISTYPDWDNYGEDWCITLNGVVVARYEG